jgi:hypothetical protein
VFLLFSLYFLCLQLSSSDSSSLLWHLFLAGQSALWDAVPVQMLGARLAGIRLYQEVEEGER